MQAAAAGRTLLSFVHVGRNTWLPHETVAMVLQYRADTREAVIRSAWGPDTDWVRNPGAARAVQVKPGRETFTPIQRFPSGAQALDVTARFRLDHPWRSRLVSAVFRWGDFRDDATVRELVAVHSFVAFSPASIQTTTSRGRGSAGDEQHQAQEAAAGCRGGICGY